MANIQYYDVILKPVITEKSMDLMADKKYTFLVHTEATKAQIKEAVEKMFEGTEVKTVKKSKSLKDCKIRNYIRCKSVKQIIRRNERRESNGNQNI